MSTRWRSAPLAATLLAASTTGCSRSQGTAKVDSGQAPASFSGAGLASSVFPAQASRSTAPCSVVEAIGRVQVDTGEGHVPLVVSTRDPLPWPAWITLSDGAHLTVDAPPSGHDLSFVGPATVEPCTRGEAAVSLVEGRFQATASSRVATGEETIVTPFAIVRYERAVLTVTVSSTATIAQITDGQATAFDESAMSFVPLPIGTAKTWSGPASTLAAATIAVSRCESDVTSARALDITPSSDAGDAHARAAHVAARAHCALANLRVQALQPADAPRAALILRLDALDPL